MAQPLRGLFTTASRHRDPSVLQIVLCRCAATARVDVGWDDIRKRRVAGNIYFVETGSHRIHKVAPNGIMTTVAGAGFPPCSGPGQCFPLGDGGPATSAPPSLPTGVAVDDNGNLFIADYGNLRVRKV
jgi:hypothetical protein